MKEIKKEERKNISQTNDQKIRKTPNTRKKNPNTNAKKKKKNIKNRTIKKGKHKDIHKKTYER